MKVKILKLQPGSRFHFGQPLIDSDTSLTDTDIYLHSDVLFSALVNNLSSVCDEDKVNQFVRSFHEGEITISSAFYCLEKNGKFYYFLPKPVNVINQIGLNDYDKIKNIKKVRFVESSLLGNLNNLDDIIKKWDNPSHIILSETTLKYLTGERAGHQKSISEFFRKKLNTQVGIRAVKQDEEDEWISKGPFNVGYIQIADLSEWEAQVHFYFMYEIKNDAIKKEFEMAAELLKYNGVGGERTGGFGQIKDIIENEIPFPNDGDADSYLTLSKTIPQNEEELERFSAYTHRLRGGRNTGSQKLKFVRVIDEGAIVQEKIEGGMAELSSDSNQRHLRNGKAFLWPLHNNSQKGENE